MKGTEEEKKQTEAAKKPQQNSFSSLLQNVGGEKKDVEMKDAQDEQANKDFCMDMLGELNRASNDTNMPVQGGYSQFDTKNIQRRQDKDEL